VSTGEVDRAARPPAWDDDDRGEFVDTNILVYAHDSSANGKRRRAAALIARLAREQRGLLSVQVLMEFYVTVTRKLDRPLRSALAADIVTDLSTWETFAPGPSDILEAIGVARRYQISFWDALIIHAAIAQNAAVIWSEDLSHGQRYAGVTVCNPFRADPAASAE